VNRAAPNVVGSATANKAARGAGQVRAGVSGEPAGANCSRSEAVDGHEDGGCGPDLVAMLDGAGGQPVVQFEDGMCRESSGAWAGEARHLNRKDTHLKRSITVAAAAAARVAGYFMHRRQAVK
jgi:hypothetical protein